MERFNRKSFKGSDFNSSFDKSVHLYDTTPVVMLDPATGKSSKFVGYVVFSCFLNESGFRYKIDTFSDLKHKSDSNTLDLQHFCVTSLKNSIFLYAVKMSGYSEENIKDKLSKHLNKYFSLLKNKTEQKASVETDGYNVLIKAGKNNDSLLEKYLLNEIGRSEPEYKIIAGKFYDYYCREEVYPNQIDTAQKIRSSFAEGDHIALLDADMQSGKTGVCMSLSAIIKEYGIDSDRDKVDIAMITGMNDKAWCYQMKWRNVFSRPNKLEVKDNVKWEPIIEEDHIVSNKGFDKLDERFVYNTDPDKKRLLIIDESHYGTNADSQVAILFDNLGVSLSDPQTLKEANLYVLFVSATDYYTRLECEKAAR